MGAISDLLREIKINQDIKKIKEKEAKENQVKEEREETYGKVTKEEKDLYELKNEMLENHLIDEGFTLVIDPETGCYKKLNYYKERLTLEDAKLRYRKRHPNCKWCEFSFDENIEGKKMYMCLIKDDYSDESCEVYQPRMPKEE